MTIISQQQQKQPYVGAGIILTRKGTNETHYLLLKGRDTGVWSFSKGHPEVWDCDAPLRTAVRETFEETGLQAGRDYRIMGNSIRFGKRPYWVGIMTEPFANVVVCRNEHSMAGWFTWEEICHLKANTDVRCWTKKSRGPNGQFMRLAGLLPSPFPESVGKQDTHLNALDHIVS